MTLVTSDKYDSISQSCQKLGLPYHMILAQLRSDSDDDVFQFDEAKRLAYIKDIIPGLPIRLWDYSEATSLLTKAVASKKYDKFKEFVNFVNRDHYFEDFDPRSTKMTNFRTIQMYWELTLPDNKHRVADIVKVYQSNFKQLSDPHFKKLCFRVL